MTTTTTKTTITATIHRSTYQPPNGVPVWHTIGDACRAMGASETSIRRAMRAAGVQRVAGASVAGMVELRASITNGFRTGYVPFAR